MAPSIGRVVTVIVLGVAYQTYTKYFDNTPCHKDPPISFASSKSSSSSNEYDACDLFSADYDEARSKFRAALKPYKGIVEELAIPIAPNKETREAFTMDVAIFPGNTEKYGTVVHSSGLHGVEGYAGSAIQIALLQEDILKLQDSADRPTIVVLHTLNPMGMTTYRRCNENNVDLNRNAIHGGDFASFLEQRDPNIANYESFRSFLSPTDDDNAVLPTSWYAKVGIWLTLLPELFEHGFVALKRAMVAGQYHHAKGIFFGGRELQPSLQRLEEFMDSRPDLFRDAPSMIWIDVHTGLGPFGKDSVHYHRTKSFGNAPQSSVPPTAAEMKQQVFSTAYSVTSSMAEQETSEAFVGYDLSKGMLTEFLAESYNGSGVFLVQEFGTQPAILVGRALILDNMLYQQKDNRHDSIAKETFTAADGAYRSPWLKEAFYPQSTLWRSSIVKRGVALMLQAIDLSHRMTQGDTQSQ